MQVNQVKNDISFGYNKRLNAKLIEQLQTSAAADRPVLNTLLEFNRFTNNLENTVRNADKRGNTSVVDKLSTFFTESKVWLASAIEELFPALNYTRKEISSYSKELFAVPDFSQESWLCKLTAGLIATLPEAPMLLGQMNADIMAGEDAPESSEGTNDGSVDVFPPEYTEINGVRTRLLKIPNEMVESLGIEGAIREYQKMFPPEETSDADEVNGVKDSDGEDINGADLVKEYVPTEAAKLGFASLGGMKELKEILNERIVGILRDPEQAKLDEIEYGKKFPKGILLYGPPGCGKTTIIEHLSVEAGVPLFKLEAGSIGSKYIHETSTNIDAAFDYIEEKAKDKPALVFIDDADALFGSRNEESGNHHVEEIGTFLNRIQKAGDKNIMVVAATNKYDLMDEALRSRFEEQIMVGLPDKDARKSLLKMFLEARGKGKKLAQDEEAISSIALKTASFPIRAIKMITDKASILALKDGRRDISVADFEKIISESASMKVKAQNYQTNSNRPSVGFNQ